MTDDVVAAEEFVDEDDFFQFFQGFRTQVSPAVALPPGCLCTSRLALISHACI